MEQLIFLMKISTDNRSLLRTIIIANLSTIRFKIMNWRNSYAYRKPQWTSKEIFNIEQLEYSLSEKKETMLFWVLGWRASRMYIMTTWKRKARALNKSLSFSGDKFQNPTTHKNLLRFELIPYPPYSPYSATCDIYFFLQLKRDFRDNIISISRTMSWRQLPSPEFGKIRNNFKGGYIEKLIYYTQWCHDKMLAVPERIFHNVP